MAKLVKQTPLIPLAPIKYSGNLTNQQRNCLAWHVLSNCAPVEAFVLFVHPELNTSPSVAQTAARQFFGSKDAIDFMNEYTKLIRNIGKPTTNSASAKPIIKEKSESDADFKKRRKREAAERVVDKIIDRVDEVEDIESLLDTIKAMKDTKFFDDEAIAQRPPMRYLPETCNSCAYKQFIDEQVELGNIKKA